MKSTNMLEHLNEQICRRTSAGSIFPPEALTALPPPNAESCQRLVRALHVETREAWLESHIYLNMQILKEHKKEILQQAT